MKVIVYGSLKEGWWNHYLLRSAEFLGKIKTLPVFTMISLGAFPAVLPDGDTAIHGELYEVNEETLAMLDRLEGHPHWYKRVEVGMEGTEEKAWMYLMHDKHLGPNHSVVESGNWSK